MSAPSALARSTWYARGPLALALWPLSVLYGLAVRLRRAAFAAGWLRRERLPVPVVVVGNFLAGGTGKTPLVEWLARELAARGRHPGIVSRGYGGDATGPREVRPDSPPASVGDEPLMLARALDLPVWVGRDRPAAARALLASRPEVDLILLDDGLQHLALERDVEVAVFDRRGTGNGFLIPAGPLREPVRVVDAVVRNAAPAAPGEYGMRLVPRRLRRLADAVTIDPESLRGARLHAVAGIGDPGRFFDTLAGLGLAFTPHPFPDHHPFRESELRFADCDAVLMTEKDAVKCAAFAAGSPVPLIVVEVAADVDTALLERIVSRTGPGIAPAR